MNLDVRFHNWSYGGYTDRNVEATIYGTNNSKNEIYIICAHFDSVPGSPGADDDGSGIAAVMSAANIISQYEVNYTIRFVTFSGEEEGLYGSYKYAQEAYGNGDNIVGVLNADMIGYADTMEGGNNVTIRQNKASIWLTDYIVNVSLLYHEYINLEIFPEFDQYGYSDHYSFWQFGYDAIQYREFETNPYYHTPFDTIQNMNITYSVKCSKLALGTLAELAKSVGTANSPPNVPTINGTKEGKIGEEIEYTFITSDPDENDVSYFVDWGDNTTSNWTDFSISGTEISLTHQWTEQGTYIIKAKAKDIYNAESNWSEFEVIIPRSRVTNLWFQWFFERFPLLEKLLTLIRVI
jgi:hypothetical protein